MGGEVVPARDNDRGARLREGGRLHPTGELDMIPARRAVSPARLTGYRTSGRRTRAVSSSDNRPSSEAHLGPRLSTMNEDQPGLFDLPGQDRLIVPDRPQPGKNRETWACTVTAEVTIVDPEALRDAAERAEESAVEIGLSADSAVGDSDAEDTADLFDMLAWMIWPTDGLEDLLEAEAIWILGVDIEMAEQSDDACTLSWTVKVQLTDVAEFRRLAAQAHPDKAGLIDGSLAVAWQHAADPLATLRSIPGIAWRPTEVAVHRVPRRSRSGDAHHGT